MFFRKIISLTMLLSFILMSLTGVVLYIAPEGRVAYWTNWMFIGLNKTNYNNLHTTTSFLFILVSVVHIYLNWRSIVSYLKNRLKKVVVITPSFLIALVINLFVLVGTYYNIEPMKSVIVFGNSISKNWSKKYPPPPFGHAELSSLKTVCRRMELDLDRSVTLLKKHNIKFQSTSETLKEIAARNNTSPDKIYDIIKPLEKESAAQNSPKGVGRMSLKELSNRYSIDLDRAVKRLSARGFNVNKNMMLKEIAEQKGMSPSDVYEIIKQP